MINENLSEGKDQLLDVAELRKAVDDLKRVSGVPELQNDPRVPLPNATLGNHPLSKFFRLDALAPSTDPSRPKTTVPPFEREDLKSLRDKAVEEAKKPNATWDQQLNSTVMDYYFTRERLPAGTPQQGAIETGTNMHITRLLTNVYGVSEFTSTLDLYVKFLEANPGAKSLRNPRNEEILLQDAKHLSALMPYWGRVIQVYFLSIQSKGPEEANARRLMQEARNAIPKDIVEGIPADVSTMKVDKLLETLSPIEGRLRNIVFAQSDVIDPPRYSPTVIEKLVTAVTGKEDQDQLRAALARIGLSEAKTSVIQGRRVHVTYINMLSAYRRNEADEIIKKAGSGKVPPEDIAKLFKNHHAIGQKIMEEHRFGLQTTTAHMFAGTLGVAESLKQNPENKLNPLRPEEVQQPPFQNFLKLMERSSKDPQMQGALREQRVKSAEGVRNYTKYMKEESLSLRVNLKLLDAAYVQPVVRNLTEGIENISKMLEGKVSLGANWVIWGPVLAGVFPSLRNLPFDTDPAGARKRLEEAKKEAEGELAKVRSLSAVIDKTRADLDKAEKELEPHLLIIEKMSSEDILDPAKVQKAQESVQAIAEIDQRIGTIIGDAWGSIEVNMKHHAETVSIVANSQNSLEHMAMAIGAALAHVGYNRLRAGRFMSANFAGRMLVGPLSEVRDAVVAARKVGSFFGPDSRLGKMGAKAFNAAGDAATKVLNPAPNITIKPIVDAQPKVVPEKPVQPTPRESPPPKTASSPKPLEVAPKTALQSTEAATKEVQALAKAAKDAPHNGFRLVSKVAVPILVADGAYRVVTGENEVEKVKGALLVGTAIPVVGWVGGMAVVLDDTVVKLIAGDSVSSAYGKLQAEKVRSVKIPGFPTLAVGGEESWGLGIMPLAPSAADYAHIMLAYQKALDVFAEKGLTPEKLKASGITIPTIESGKQDGTKAKVSDVKALSDMLGYAAQLLNDDHKNSSSTFRDDRFLTINAGYAELNQKVDHLPPYYRGPGADPASRPLDATERRWDGFSERQKRFDSLKDETKTVYDEYSRIQRSDAGAKREQELATFLLNRDVEQLGKLYQAQKDFEAGVPGAKSVQQLLAENSIEAKKFGDSYGSKQVVNALLLTSENFEAKFEKLQGVFEQMRVPNAKEKGMKLMMQNNKTGKEEELTSLHQFGITPRSETLVDTTAKLRDDLSKAMYEGKGNTLQTGKKFMEGILATEQDTPRATLVKLKAFVETGRMAASTLRIEREPFWNGRLRSVDKGLGNDKPSETSLFYTWEKTLKNWAELSFSQPEQAREHAALIQTACMLLPAELSSYLKAKYEGARLNSAK